MKHILNVNGIILFIRSKISPYLGTFPTYICLGIVLLFLDVTELFFICEDYIISKRNYLIFLLI